LLPAVPHLPVGYDMRLSPTVLLFCAVVSIVTGVLFGLAPAWQAVKTNLNDTLKQSGRTGAPSSHSHWLRSFLVVSEVALALVLLIGMTLCARSLQHAGQIDRGLDPTHVWGAGFRLPPVGYDEDRTRNTYRRLRERLAALPGVESVG